MSCSQTLAGLAKSCDVSNGGIKAVWIANFTDVSATTVDSAQTVSAITMVSSAKYKKYHFKRNTASMTHTLNVNAENGSNYVTTDVALVFHRQDALKRVEMAAISVGELSMIVEDVNGKYWMIGDPAEFPVKATAGGGESGTAMADRNAYTTTLSADSFSYPKEILASAVAAVVDEI